MTTHIVILGAGYSGLLMALRLARTTRPLGARVTLVDASPDFADRIRQHELSARSQQPRRVDTLTAAAGVDFVLGRVTSINLAHRLVRIQKDGGETELRYDRLVYALGSYTDPDAVAGIREHAHVFSRRDVERMRAALPALAARSGHLLVCGGGLTGIEAAAEFAEAYPALRVTLATSGTLGAGASPRAQRYLRAAFVRLGIHLLEDTRVTRIDAGRAHTSADPIDFDLCLWAGAFAVPPLAREAGLRVNQRGQALVDGGFQSLSHPAVMVVGDAAAPALDVGAPVRMACASATAMGAHAADALAASLRGAVHRPFRINYLARNISLGRRDGVIDWVTSDDRPRNRIWTGRLAAAYKNLIGTFVWRSISGELLRSSAYQIALARPNWGKPGDNAQHYARSK